MSSAFLTISRHLGKNATRLPTSLAGIAVKIGLVAFLLLIFTEIGRAILVVLGAYLIYRLVKWYNLRRAGEMGQEPGESIAESMGEPTETS